MKQKINKFVIDIHKPYEMARVKLNGEIIFLGNFWDYHPGCHGTVWEVNGKNIELGDDWECYESFCQYVRNQDERVWNGRLYSRM